MLMRTRLQSCTDHRLVEDPWCSTPYPSSEVSCRAFFTSPAPCPAQPYGPMSLPSRSLPPSSPANEQMPQWWGSEPHQSGIFTSPLNSSLFSLNNESIIREFPKLADGDLVTLFEPHHNLCTYWLSNPGVVLSPLVLQRYQPWQRGQGHYFLLFSI